jgi:hypothetical protein
VDGTKKEDPTRTYITRDWVLKTSTTATCHN